MRFIVQSQIVKEVDSAAKRFERWHILHVTCRVLFRLFLVVPCLGALVAPSVVFGMLLRALHSFRIPYWIAVATILAGLAFLLFAFGWGILANLRRHVINLEVIVAFTSYLIAAIIIGYTLSTRCFFHGHATYPVAESSGRLDFGKLTYAVFLLSLMAGTLFLTVWLWLRKKR